MAAVSRVNNVVSKQGGLKQEHFGGRRLIGWFLESITKYAVDVSLHLSPKPKKGVLQLHKTVQEELKDAVSLNVGDDLDKQKLDTVSRSEKEMTKMEKMQEEINVASLKNMISTEKLEPVSSEKFPPEQVKERNILMPNRNRIMIRSRL